MTKQDLLHLLTMLLKFSQSQCSADNKAVRDHSLIAVDTTSLDLLALQSQRRADYKAVLDDSLITVDTTSLD